MIRLYSNGSKKYTDYDFFFLQSVLQTLIDQGICGKQIQNCNVCKCRTACEDLQHFIDYVNRVETDRVSANWQNEHSENSDFVK